MFVKPLLCLATALTAFGRASAQTVNAKEQELVRLARQRFEAFFEGDKATYERLLARDIIFAYSNGRLLDYTTAMHELVPLAKPGSFTFHYEDVQFRDFGETVLLVYRLVFSGPEGGYQGIESDLFARRNGAWQLTAVHGTTIPYPARQPVVVAPQLLDEYTGRYESTSGSYYTITRRGSQLMGQRDGYPKKPWMPEANDVFYVLSDPTATRIFLRDSDGRVMKIVRVDIQGNTIWQRRSRTRP